MLLLLTPLKITNFPLLAFAVEKKRLAYVITITKDGYFGLDGAAVLAYSIINSTSDISRAEYDISFIAFVHPDVITTRPGLQKLGRFQK